MGVNGVKWIIILIASYAGGMTYCSIAAYSLASRISSLKRPEAAVRWLVSRQVSPPARNSTDDSEEEEQAVEEDRIPVAGFQGRIGKDTDACYSFWCTASLQVSTSYSTMP